VSSEPDIGAGCTTPFRDLGWAAVVAHFDDPPGMAGPSDDLEHLRAIAASVVEQGRADDLAVSSGAVAT